MNPENIQYCLVPLVYQVGFYFPYIDSLFQEYEVDTCLSLLTWVLTIMTLKSGQK